MNEWYCCLVVYAIVGVMFEERRLGFWVEKRNWGLRRMLGGSELEYTQMHVLKNSGVATGWHGWTMSRGPGVKGAPRERQKKKENEKLKKK